MAIATLKEPYATFSGSLFARDDVYARMLDGKCIVGLHGAGCKLFYYLIY